MNALIVLSAVLAVAAAAPTNFVTTYAAPPFHYGAAPVAFSSRLAYASPAGFAYGAPVAAPVAYSAPVAYAAPVATAYSGPIAYASPAVHVEVPSAPAVYKTGTKIESTYEPVEQHGYQIVY